MAMETTNLAAPAGVRTGVKLSGFTHWQVGGEARYFIEPTTVEEVVEALAWAKAQALSWAAIGRGSNMLVSDDGFPGLVIRMGNAFSGVRFEDGRMHAQAGLALAQMVVQGHQHGLGGLEPMVGVPGTVGGAVTMNASMLEVAISAGFESGRVLLDDGTIATWSYEDFRFSYRHSRLQDERGVFLDGTWTLKPIDPAEGRKQVRELQQWRNTKQPTNLPSGGSTFRNPGGGHPSAGALIEQVGAKGLRIGQAEVSEKHANFIVNLGGATASDVNAVIKEVQTRVWEQHHVWLHPEVVGLGLTVGHTR
ncbi:MAG: UDP-N-acetylmuramate dehydrogenase [Candidatus Sericytochromatia bacterium]